MFYTFERFSCSVHTCVDRIYTYIEKKNNNNNARILYNTKFDRWVISLVLTTIFPHPSFPPPIYICTNTKGLPQFSISTADVQLREKNNNIKF